MPRPKSKQVQLDEANASLAVANQEKARLNGEIEELKTANQSLRNQVDEKETKKLAESYEVVATMYETDYLFYRKWTIIMVAIIFSVGGAYFAASFIYDFTWITKLNFLSFYGVLIFGLYFLVRQYSFYRNLFVDMRHRQTLAQGYYNIMSSSEDAEIRPQLAAKTIDFLTTPPHVKESDMGTPLEAMTKAISNLQK